MIIKSFDLSDVFLLSETIDKMDIEVDISKLSKNIGTSKVENGSDAMELGKEVVVSIGADLIIKIIRNLHKAQKEVKQLIGNMTGMNQEAVSKMGIKQIKEFFAELIEHEGFEDFLSQEGTQE